MPKPFTLQAPEDIAKEYGGNKQKIAQAMQMGVVDPTAGTLAGMFIDRMRSAQMQEGAQQPSVAQQVFAPPAPPAPPMGGPPMGAPPAPPMGGMPPGGPPMGAPPAPPMGGMPPGAPPMGMADGGLAALPVPENMFDEPMDGEYAGGGIVAFADAGPVGYMQEAPEDEELEAVGSRGRYGFAPTFEGNMGLIEKYAPQQSKYGDKLTSFYEAEMSPEAQKKRRDEDKYFALAQLGATMAGTPGSLLQAFGAGVGKALPGLQESAKARRAEQRDAIKTLAAREDMTNKQATDAFRLAGDLQKAYGGFMDTEAQRKLTKEMNEADNEVRIAAQLLANKGQKDVAVINKNAQLDYFTKQEANLVKDVKAKAVAALPALRSTLDNPVGLAHNAFRKAQASGNKAEAALAADAISEAERAFVASQVALVSGGTPPSPGAEVGSVPGGKIVVQNGKRVFVPGG
jgi:hypothetical protein